MADALFTTMSIPPNVLTATSTASWIWVSFLTSTTHGRHRPPAALTVSNTGDICDLLPIICVLYTARHYIFTHIQLYKLVCTIGKKSEHTFFSCSINCPRQCWMRLGSPCRNNYISPVSSGFKCYSFSNTSASSRDEQRATSQFPKSEYKNQSLCVAKIKEFLYPVFIIFTQGKGKNFCHYRLTQ